jgi:hypothetical protein
MNSDAGIAIAVTILCVFFYGDPDLSDAIIAWLGRH